MKTSDIQGEKALDMLADILEPAVEILADKEIKDSFAEGKKPISIVKTAIKKHKKAVIEILAALDGVPAEEYHCTIFSLPAKLLEIINDKDFQKFFISQAQMGDAISSVPAMANTTE